MKTLKQLQSTATKINATLKENDQFIFLNFPKGDSYDKAVQWGKEQGLTLSTKEDIESMKDDDLPTLFEKTYGYIVETTGCTFDGVLQACSVWWGGSERKANLYWQSNFGDSGGWFVFRKSSDTGKLTTPQILNPLSSELSAQEQETAAIILLKQRGFKITKEY